MEHPEFLRQTEERLLRYAAVTTQSRHFAGVWPTTDCQRDLAKLLYEELLGLGLRAAYDEARCVVYGWIPAAQVAEDRPIALSELAGQYGCEPITIAAAWILRHPAKMQVIAGTMNPDHLKDICDSVKAELTHQEWYKLYLASGKFLP